MYVKISLQKGKKTPLISLIKFSFIVSTNQLNKPQKWSSHCGARGSAASRHSEFKRIWCCLSCRIDPNCGNCSSDLIPGVGTPYADSQKKKKKKKINPSTYLIPILLFYFLLGTMLISIYVQHLQIITF